MITSTFSKSQRDCFLIFVCDVKKNLKKVLEKVCTWKPLTLQHTGHYGLPPTALHQSNQIARALLVNTHSSSPRLVSGDCHLKVT